MSMTAGAGANKKEKEATEDVSGICEEFKHWKQLGNNFLDDIPIAEEQGGKPWACDLDKNIYYGLSES